MFEKYAENHFKNQKNFLEISAIFSNTRNLTKKSPKILQLFYFFFKFLKIIPKLFKDSFIAMFSNSSSIFPENFKNYTVNSTIKFLKSFPQLWHIFSMFTSVSQNFLGPNLFKKFFIPIPLKSFLKNFPTTQCSQIFLTFTLFFKYLPGLISVLQNFFEILPISQNISLSFSLLFLHKFFKIFLE